MKPTSILFAAVVLLPTLAIGADHNLGVLAKANKIEVFNRTLDQTKADSPQAVFLNAAPNDGLAWITGVELSEGTIELEIKGKNEQSRSFVGIAFHGQDNRVFDAVYLRPFNFQATEHERSQIRLPPSAEEPRLRRRGRAHSRAGNRGKHGNLHADQHSCSKTRFRPRYRAVGQPLLPRFHET